MSNRSFDDNVLASESCLEGVSGVLVSVFGWFDMHHILDRFMRYAATEINEMDKFGLWGVCMTMDVHVEHTHEGVKIQGVTIEGHKFHLG